MASWRVRPYARCGRRCQARKVPKIVKATKAVGKVAQKGTKGAAVARGVRRVNVPKSFSNRAPELLSGQICEIEFLKTAEKFLDKGYKEISPGRYISKDGLRQIRYGIHEVESAVHHAHFEAYNHAGGKIIENAASTYNRLRYTTYFESYYFKISKT